MRELICKSDHVRISALKADGLNGKKKNMLHFGVLAESSAPPGSGS